MKIGIILITILTLLTIGIAGCTPPSSESGTTGLLQVLVTDAPPKQEVTSIMVTVDSVSVHKAVAGEEETESTTTPTTATTMPPTTEETTTPTTEPVENESGWMPLDILEGKATFDLLQIKGIEEVLAVSELEVGKYTQIRMIISNVQVKLGDGELQDATLPSGKLKFVHPFDIEEGQTTALLFDFVASESVNVTGNNIIFKPVIKLTKTNPKGDETENGVKITTPSLPNGAVGVAFNYTMAASGGVTPYTWSIESGTLPAGLTIDAVSGVVSGTPTAPGDVTFTGKVVDSASPVKSDSEEFTVSIAATGALIITTTSLPDAVKNTAYSAPIAVLGGVSPYTWSVTSGNLPAGLTINTATGAISGTPTGQGKAVFTVQVSDTATPAATDTQQLSIQVK